MLVVRKPGSAGVDCEFKVMGETITVKVKPLDVASQEDVRNKHRHVKFVKGPDTKQMQRVVWVDGEKVGDELINVVVEDIKGVVGEDGQALEMSMAVKKAVMYLRADSSDLTQEELKDIGEDEVIDCPECGAKLPVPEQYRQKKPLLWLLVLKKANELAVVTEEQWASMEKN